MAAARGLGQVVVEVAVVDGRVVPGVVHVQPREDRPLGRQPGPPARLARPQVEVREDLELGRDRVERVRLARVEPAGAEREHRVADDAELARDVERGLEARPLRLDERRRSGDERVGLLRGHPDEARREQRRLAIRPVLTKCQRSTESALAQPTHEPVEPWSATVHQVARRSFEAGMRRRGHRPSRPPPPSRTSSPPRASATASR